MIRMMDEELWNCGKCGIVELRNCGIVGIVELWKCGTAVYTYTRHSYYLVQGTWRYLISMRFISREDQRDKTCWHEGTSVMAMHQGWFRWCQASGSISTKTWEWAFEHSCISKRHEDNDACEYGATKPQSVGRMVKIEKKKQTPLMKLKRDVGSTVDSNKVKTNGIEKQEQITLMQSKWDGGR